MRNGFVFVESTVTHAIYLILFHCCCCCINKLVEIALRYALNFPTSILQRLRYLPPMKNENHLMCATVHSIHPPMLLGGVGNFLISVFWGGSEISKNLGGGRAFVKNFHLGKTIENDFSLKNKIYNKNFRLRQPSLFKT